MQDTKFTRIKKYANLKPKQKKNLEKKIIKSVLCCVIVDHKSQILLAKFTYELNQHKITH